MRFYTVMNKITHNNVSKIKEMIVKSDHGTFAKAEVNNFENGAWLSKESVFDGEVQSVRKLEMMETTVAGKDIEVLVPYCANRFAKKPRYAKQQGLTPYLIILKWSVSGEDKYINDIAWAKNEEDAKRACLMTHCSDENKAAANLLLDVSEDVVIKDGEHTYAIFYITKMQTHDIKLKSGAVLKTLIDADATDDGKQMPILAMV